MNAKKQDSVDEETPAKGASRSTGRGGRWLVIAAIVSLMTGGACFAVWQQVRTHVLSSSEYQVDPDKVFVTPPPPWIHSDVRAEVIRDANIAGPLTMLDPQLTVRLASQFAAHPWVAHVERVSKKYPSSVDVVLTYRKPVAMVEVQGGALPVDASGVLLPTADFSAADAENYPRVTAIYTTPSGPAGQRWGDPAVTGAAQIAGALAADWNALELTRIEPAGEKPSRVGKEHVFMLFSRGGTRIYWGRAPSSDLPGELSVRDKLAQLRRYVADHGSLTADGAPQLEFADNGDLIVKARPLVRPLPKNDPR